MKIGILTHFHGFTDSYALHVGWLERAKLLQYFNQDFDFLVTTGCKQEYYPHQKAILKGLSEKRPYEERVKFFTEQYLELLKDYDAILTADLIYQKKGNFLAYNQAMRNVAPHIKAHWFHWVHSSWTDRPNNIQYPDSLRYEMMEKSTLVYLNSAELDGLAKQYGTTINNCACVYNPKDFRSFNEFHPLSWEISKKLDFANKDCIQIFPHCATRMDAKGVDFVIKTFAELKKKGMRVALVLATGNAKSVLKEIEQKKQMMKNLGLIDGKDFLYTHEITSNYAALPRKAVADIYKCANIFIFASWRETCGNVFQEAKISGNLLVLNKALPCLREMGGDDAIFFYATHKTPGIIDGHTGDIQQVCYSTDEKYISDLADMIIKKAESKRHLWQFSYDWIWENQFKPLLYGKK